jgi:hypothetical protein
MFINFLLRFLGFQMMISGAMASVPHSITHQGFMTDSSGIPLNGSYAMRFGIYLDSVRVWYSEYSAVQFSQGYYTVSLGSNSQGGAALDPVTELPINNSALEVAPVLLNTNTISLTELEISISNGSQFETLAPRIKKDSTLFALRAESLEGYGASSFAKFNSAGEILSSNGVSIISANGTWIGSNSGLMGPQGAKGDKGEKGDKGDKGEIGPQGLQGIQGLMGPQGPQGLKGDKGDTGLQGPQGIQGLTGPQGPAGQNAVLQTKTLFSQMNSAKLILDCGVGYAALSGGGDCSSGGSRIVSSCPVAASNASSCVTNSNAQQFWMIKCSSSNSNNKIYATCIKI